MDPKPFTLITNNQKFSIGCRVSVEGHGWCGAKGTITEINMGSWRAQVTGEGRSAWIPITSLSIVSGEWSESSEEHDKNLFVKKRIRPRSFKKPTLQDFQISSAIEILNPKNKWTHAKTILHLRRLFGIKPDPRGAIKKKRAILTKSI